MTKEQALAKIKEIISKDQRFTDAKIKVTFLPKTKVQEARHKSA